MLKWNKKDFNVENIVVESKILDYPVLYNNYRIYGSVDTENEVTVGYLSDVYPYFNQKVSKLCIFLSINGIKLKILKNEDYKWNNNHIFRIGLNEKLRDNIKLSSAIIKTIIGVSEGHIPLQLKQYGAKFI